MLRDLPPYHAPPDIEVLMNTPGTQDEPFPTSTTYIDPLDDVFGSAPPSPTLNVRDDQADVADSATSTSRLADHPSDVARLRSVHVTNGYREGIAASKEKHIQEGFDEGYSLGAEIALKAGRVIGSLEGLCHALANHKPDKPPTVAEDAAESSQDLVEAIKLLQRAEEELKMGKLFSKQCFGDDGVWSYHVPEKEDESAVTFTEVAEAHPIIMTWNKILDDLCAKLGMVLG